MRLPDVVAHLGLNVGITVVNRYIAGARCDPYVLEQLDKGNLDWGHVRVIQGLTEVDQRKWAEKAVALRPTVRQLREMVSGASIPKLSPDLQRYQADIQAGLQADVQLFVKGRGHYRLEIGWAWLPSLLGVLEQLGRAPMPDNADDLPQISRQLVLELDSDRELEALVSHLIPER